MEKSLYNVFLQNGQKAIEYVMNLSEEFRLIATAAILECLRLGYPLNDMEITSKAREMLRMQRVYA